IGGAEYDTRQKVPASHRKVRVRSAEKIFPLPPSGLFGGRGQGEGGVKPEHLHPGILILANCFIL
ncbi:hypothetical protein LJC47_06820, partial [Desulfosarcina sp. OttesenSCG-928-B08]|nr:hypothetical protein [Desulfosarcina sp. OttesenSCG-928-B08]